MDTGNTQVAYKKGDVYLCCRAFSETDLREVELLEVAQAAKAVKTDLYGWMDAAAFHTTVKGKLGHAEYRGVWPFKRRVLVRA